MTEAELKRALAMKSGLSQPDAMRLLTDLAQIVGVNLDADDPVTLPGIGKFTVKHRAARTGRNPKTGEALEIPEKRVVTFAPAKTLREWVA